jgi:sialate O-acetylesterase
MVLALAIFPCGALLAEVKAVRYSWANVPDVNLFNHEGLPASPFRTDED